MNVSRGILMLVVALSAVAVAAAFAGALAGLCDLGARLTDVVGMRLTLLAGQLEDYRTPLVAASFVALVPAAWLGHRGALLTLRFVVWTSAILVVAGAFLPWVLHRVM